MVNPYRVLSEVEAVSFHDCHVDGLRWKRGRFDLLIDLQYIVEWIPPRDGELNYQFMIAPATLVFEGAYELNISMDWRKSALDATIDSIDVMGHRLSPNGTPKRRFEIVFHDVDGSIAVWSRGYRVELHQAPVLSKLQVIRPSDES